MQTSILTLHPLPWRDHQYCTDCENHLPVTAFYEVQVHRKERVVLKPLVQCVDCNRAMQRERYHSITPDRSCACCGAKDLRVIDRWNGLRVCRACRYLLQKIDAGTIREREVAEEAVRLLTHVDAYETFLETWRSDTPPTQSQLRHAIRKSGVAPEALCAARTHDKCIQALAQFAGAVRLMDGA